MSAEPTFKGKLLLQELALFGFVQILGVWAALRLISQTTFMEIKVAASLWEFVISFVLATILMIVFLRFIKGGQFFKILFTLVIFLGSQAIFSIFMPGLLAAVWAFLLVLSQFIVPSVWLHNLAIIFGVSGVGAAFGLSLPLGAVLIILFILSLYDYVAVYKTEHMVLMFKELLQRGVIFAIILPTKFGGWTSDLVKVKSGTDFLFLGTGDLVMPLVLAVSAAISYGIESAVFVIGGSLVGVAVLHVLFTSQPKRAPMPALPLLALFSVLGLLISILIK